jgi:hypothetical protein
MYVDYKRIKNQCELGVKLAHTGIEAAPAARRSGSSKDG